MGLARFALRHPHLVVVILLIIALLGTVSALRIPTDLLPVFKSPAVQVVTFYPGMPAEVMERDITSRLERWTGQSNGVALQEAKSMIGVSIVRDYFRPDIDPNTAMSQVTSLAMSDLFYLPPGTIPPMVMPFDPTASLPLGLLSVSSASFDETKLYDVAYFDLRNRLQGITGVIAPAVYGGKLRRILAYVDPMKLQARGLSPLDVVNGIRRQNVLIPTGNAKFGDYEFQIDAQGMLPAVPDLDGVPIRTSNGIPVYLRDVGRAEDSAQIQTNIVRINGRRQVYIPIYRQPGANTIAVIDGVRAALDDILKRLPSGIDLDVVLDQSVYVRKAIRDLVTEGGLGALLAGLTVLLFLGSLRSTALITLAIPVSVLAAIMGLHATGNTLNAMTLGGLALAVGRLVDDSIVVLENIERHRGLGKGFREAALEGTAEVALPVLASTITTLIVFLPIVFLTGISRFLFTPLALAVTLSMAVSYFFAMAVVPIAEARTRGDTAHGATRGEAAFTRAFHKVSALYARTARPLLRLSLPVALVALVLLGATAVLASRLGRELFPLVDTGSFTILVRAPSGLRVEKTEELMAAVEGEIRKTVPEEDIKLLITNIGVLNDWPAAYTPNSGPGDAFIAVQMTDRRSRTAADTADTLRAALPSRFPGVEFAFDAGGLVTAALNGGLPSPIDAQIEGNQLETAVEVARKVEAELKTISGAVDVRIRQRLDAPQVGITLDRVKAAQVGLTAEDVVKNLVTALNSSINFAPSFWIDPRNGNHYFIGVQYREEAIRSFETLENLPITGSGDRPPVLLKNVATLERRTAPDAIYHRNITRVVDVFANVRGRDVGSVAEELENRISRIERNGGVPRGYFVRMRGEVASFRESLGSLAFGLALAAVLVYLVLVAQFSSFLEPLLILIAVPLGGIGVVMMLLLTGTSLSIPAMLGAIFLVGIAVSNSILVVEFAGRLRREGWSPPDAIIEAGKIRLRPIAMTSIAAILGLLPMALDTESANAPLARGVIGGLLVSGLLTLYVLPPIYTSLARGTPAGDDGASA